MAPPVFVLIGVVRKYSKLLCNRSSRCTRHLSNSNASADVTMLPSLNRPSLPVTNFFRRTGPPDSRSPPLLCHGRSRQPLAGIYARNKEVI